MLKMCDESRDGSGSPHEGAGLRNVINRDRLKRERVQGMLNDVESLLRWRLEHM